MAHSRDQRSSTLDRNGKYFLVGKDLFVEKPDFTGARIIGSSAPVPVKESVTPPAPAPGVDDEHLFRFGRMFRHPNLPEFRPDEADLIKLGLAMTQKVDPGVNRKLPAGYIVLGQFIDHDITFDANESLSVGPTEPETEPSKRSPSLDLDSLYGLPPLADVKRTDIGKYVYQPDGVNLAFGSTVEDPFVAPPASKRFPHDVPRRGNPLRPTTAMIIDSRNDENLAVAQTHLAFIKFHNAVVQHLTQSGVRQQDLLDEARKVVVEHYQQIVLSDYLPKTIEADVLDRVIERGCEHFVLNPGEEAFMPVEFSVAAFRLGHALVTETYEWNKYFQSKSPRRPAQLLELFTFTGFANGTFLNFGGLPSSWVIDWTRFYDFRPLGLRNNANPSYARKLCPSIVPALADLPFFPDTDVSKRSLAVRNLLRGSILGLPAAQSVARRLRITPLTPNDITGGPNRDLLWSCGFDQLTPLWYYILREAEVIHQGERLGPLGSRIIAETFVQLIKSSKVSILSKTEPGKPSWRSVLTGSHKFSMPDLLVFVSNSLKGENENFLNPLGN